MNKKADPYFTWGNTKGSYLNTINPFSGFFGGGIRVPEWWMKAFPANTATDAGKLTAGMAFQTAACALLAAGLVGGYRALKHLNRVSEMAESDNPAGKLRSQLSTTFEGKLTPTDETKVEEKTASQQKTAEEKLDDKWVMMGPITPHNLLSLSVPFAASLLAAGAAYGLVDNWASARRNRKLDTAIKAKDNAVKQLMQARARVAKGNITEDDINKTMDALNAEDLYIKEARQDQPESGAVTALSRATIATYGFFGSLLLLASALGGYRYFSASDPNNIKYKVSKRSLADYARNKTNLTPITVVPTDQKEYFSAIDQPASATAQEEMRALPAMDTTNTGKPITVTL